MKTPQRVVWTEGMFMSPQHLQQSDRYHEALLAARLGAATPYPWGALAVQIDERALASGQLRVARFAGVLPDGLPLDFDAGHPEAPAARPVERHFPPTARVLEVFLGVAAERDGAANYAPKGAPAAGRRFVIDPRATVDAASGAAEVSVAFAQRNVVVLFGDEPREGFDAIKIAEIVRGADGALAVKESYVPPCRRIGASPFLRAGLERLLALMAAKQRTLAEGRRQRDASTVEFGAGDVTRFLLLNAINTFLPVVGHLVEAGDAPPEAVFLLLSQFAGQLCTFAADGDPTTLPRLLYTDLGGSFEALFARLTMLLQTTVRERFIRVPLESRPDGLHFGRLSDDRLTRATNWVLAVRAEVPEAQIVDQVPKLSKVASWADVTSIVQAATPGVPLVVNYRPPGEIPVRAGVVYFSLAVTDHYWRNVLAERAVAIYLPPPFEPSRIALELMAVAPADQAG